MDNSKKILKNIQIYHWSYPHYNIVVIAKNRKPILGRDTIFEIFFAPLRIASHYLFGPGLA